jgi:hypothetical protein
MAIFTATFSAVAVTAAQDVFEVVAAAGSGGPHLALREVRLAQYSDAGDAASEILSVQIITGYTVAGTGGSTVTPANVQRHTGAPTATATVLANNTTVANTGTASILISDSFNVQAGWWYRPCEEERIQLQPSQRLVVRITIPADSLTMNGTLIFEEY